MDVSIGPKIQLPTQHGSFEVCHLTVRGREGLIREGVALRKDTTTTPLLVRVQSSCLFSESFWATDCDCALQLQAALVRINRDGGVLLYFYEEGRGVGLATKFKAIELQQLQGLDTRQAYECLEMSPDPRTYEAAASVLTELLHDKPICLLSNNAEKENGLRAYGVNVVKRERLLVGTNEPAIQQYLEEKRRILKHDIPELKQ